MYTLGGKRQSYTPAGRIQNTHHSHFHCNNTITATTPYNNIHHTQTDGYVLNLWAKIDQLLNENDNESACRVMITILCL